MLKNFIKGLLFGSTVGAVGGLLLAPRSGNETRKKLTAELEEAADTTLDLNKSLQRFQQAVVTTRQTAAETLPVLQDGLKKDVESFKFQAEPRIEQIRQQVTRINEHVAQLEVLTPEKPEKTVEN